MTLQDLQDILHFAEINGMMDWPFFDVVNEYFTTKEVAESYYIASYKESH